MNGHPASTVTINITSLGNQVKNTKRQIKFLREESHQCVLAPGLMLFCLFC